MAKKRGRKKGGRGRKDGPGKKGGKGGNRTAARARGGRRARGRSRAPDLILFHSESTGEDVAWPPVILIQSGNMLDVDNRLDDIDIDAKSTAFDPSPDVKFKKKTREKFKVKADPGIHKLDLPPLGLQLAVEGAPRRSKRTFGDPDIIIT